MSKKFSNTVLKVRSGVRLDTSIPRRHMGVPTGTRPTSVLAPPWHSLPSDVKLLADNFDRRHNKLTNQASRGLIRLKGKACAQRDLDFKRTICEIRCARLLVPRLQRSLRAFEEEPLDPCTIDGEDVSRPSTPIEQARARRLQASTSSSRHTTSDGVHDNNRRVADAPHGLQPLALGGANSASHASGHGDNPHASRSCNASVGAGCASHASSHSDSNTPGNAVIEGDQSDSIARNGDESSDSAAGRGSADGSGRGNRGDGTGCDGSQGAVAGGRSGNSAGGGYISWQGDNSGGHSRESAAAASDVQGRFEGGDEADELASGAQESGKGRVLPTPLAQGSAAARVAGATPGRQQEGRLALGLRSVNGGFYLPVATPVFRDGSVR